MVRLFVGIFVPENLKQKIVSLQKEIGKLPINCKFVEPENLHISLSFLGEVEEENVKTISEKLEEVSKTYGKFEVDVSELSLIPNKNYVRVIALETKSEMLQQISRHMEKEIGGDVKPPHLTLCRVKSISDKNIFYQKISDLDSSLGKFVVDSVDLIKSELGTSGPVYTSLHKSFFN